jgi:hypothetical protein
MTSRDFQVFLSSSIGKACCVRSFVFFDAQMSGRAGAVFERKPAQWVPPYLSPESAFSLFLTN